MNPIKIPGANKEFAAPTDWDGLRNGECATLPVLMTVDDEGLMLLQSAWKPDAAELEALNHGSAVVLMIFGRGHPPVSLSVTHESVA